MKKIEPDVVGQWTEVKLKIIQEYSTAYARILNRQSYIRSYAYIDGFAGSGTHLSKMSGQEIEGSPKRALAVTPPFSHYHFIDLNGQKAGYLRSMTKARNDVSVHEGDCNSILLQEIFPKYRREDYRRALCFLDPYELNPRWEVVKAAADMRSIEIFLNFMISDANRNVFWRRPDNVSFSQINRMNAFWGDESWRDIVYEKRPGLFDDMDEKVSNETIAKAYQRRLKEVAGFEYVPDPIPMKNKKQTVLYYLFFASNNKTGDKVARSIFKKYRTRGIEYGF